MSKSGNFFLYYASPLIVDLNDVVHCPMPITYNLFVFSIKIYSQSMYCLNCTYHIFILIFDSSSFSVRLSGMCLVYKLVTGSLRYFII